MKNPTKKLVHIFDFVTSVLADQCINRAECQTWQQTDRSTLRTEITDAEDFAEQIRERLLKLKPHSFTAKQQSYFFKNLKDTLKEEEFLILCDFAENYSFVVQNAAQSFHWNNDQATIFTVVSYYKKDNILKHRSLAMLSDCLIHTLVLRNLILRNGLWSDTLKKYHTRMRNIHFHTLMLLSGYVNS